MIALVVIFVIMLLLKTSPFFPFRGIFRVITSRHVYREDDSKICLYLLVNHPFKLVENALETGL